MYARIENGFLQPLTIFSFVCLTFVWPIEIYTPSHHLLAVKHADTACMHQMHTLFVFVCPGNFKLYYLAQGDDETEEYRCTEWDRLYYNISWSPYFVNTSVNCVSAINWCVMNIVGRNSRFLETRTGEWCVIRNATHNCIQVSKTIPVTILYTSILPFNTNWYKVYYMLSRHLLVVIVYCKTQLLNSVRQVKVRIPAREQARRLRHCQEMVRRRHEVYTDIINLPQEFY